LPKEFEFEVDTKGGMPSLEILRGGGPAGDIVGLDVRCEQLKNTSNQPSYPVEESWELEKTAFRVEQFVSEFMRLAEEFGLPKTNPSFKVFKETERLLLHYLRIARDLAAQLKLPQVSDDETSLKAMFELAAQKVRRAALLIQIQVFRLDEALYDSG
jgi:hypothetical protein